MNASRLYRPGMISLFLLLPLTLFQLRSWGLLEVQRVLEVTWYDPDRQQSSPYKYSSIPDRNYTVINLTGKPDEDHLKISYARLLVDEMVAKYDTATGVRVHFHDEARYESFIRILEMCHRKDTLLCAPYQNDFWIFNYAQRPEHENAKFIPICGTAVHRRILADDVKSNSHQFLYDYFPILIILGFLFLTLGLLSMKKALSRHAAAKRGTKAFFTARSGYISTR